MMPEGQKRNVTFGAMLALELNIPLAYLSTSDLRI